MSRSARTPSGPFEAAALPLLRAIFPAVPRAALRAMPGTARRGDLHPPRSSVATTSPPTGATAAPRTDLPGDLGARRRSPDGRAGGAAFPAMGRGRYRYHLPARALVSIALVSAAAVGDSSAQERIGRLFSSPEQRLELDRLRNDAGV